MFVCFAILITFASTSTTSDQSINGRENKIERTKRQYYDYLANYYADRIFWPYPLYYNPYRRQTRPTRASIDLPTTTLRYYSIWDISRRKRDDALALWTSRHRRKLSSSASRQRRSTTPNSRAKRQISGSNRVSYPDNFDSSVDQRLLQAERLPVYSMWDISRRRRKRSEPNENDDERDRQMEEKQPLPRYSKWDISKRSIRERRQADRRLRLRQKPSIPTYTMWDIS